MSYEINDRTLIDELCDAIHSTVQEQYNGLEAALKKMDGSYRRILHIPWMRRLSGKVEN